MVKKILYPCKYGGSISILYKRNHKLRDLYGCLNTDIHVVENQPFNRYLLNERGDWTFYNEDV